MFKNRQAKIAAQHLGIIAKLVHRYWSQIPLHEAQVVSREDMIAEVVLRVVKVAHQFDRSRAQSSTFVYKVAENHCRLIVARHRQKRYMATAVMPIEDVSGSLCQNDDGRKYLESRKAIENVLREASPNVRYAFQFFLDNRKYRKGVWPEEVIKETRYLVRKHGVTYGDFMRVFHTV